MKTSPELYAMEAVRICRFNLRHWSGRLHHARINGYRPNELREHERMVKVGLNELWTAQRLLTKAQKR